jgi:hypothetical protein
MAGFGIGPRLTTTVAGKRQSMHLVALQDGQVQVAVCRNGGERVNGLPHHGILAVTPVIALRYRNPWPMFGRRRSRRPGKVAMDRFIRRENVKHFRELLKTITDEPERQRILTLLAEEEKKQHEAGDGIEVP